MRVLVTGAANPIGQAIVHALVQAGHQVRVFGGDESMARRLPDGVQWHPGDLRTAGSIEPVLSEREAVVHAACLDPVGSDRRQHAVMIEQGTLYARYGAEREQVDHFIHIQPDEGGRFEESQRKAVETVHAIRGPIHKKVIPASGGPQQTAQAVLAALAQGGRLGKQPGRENDAVTA